MNEIKEIKIDLKDNSYKIFINDDIEKILINSIEKILSRPRVFIITDENVAGFILPKIKKIFEDGGIKTKSIIIQSGEKSKSFESLEKLIKELLGYKVERQDTLIALGGGVIGDLVGFTSSIIYRGINFIQIPTTILSQVDSAVGGKTGINLEEGKNLVGSFHQPKAVFTDVSFLKTLPKKEIIAGYAEILKYSILGDKDFFNWLKVNQEEILNLNSNLVAEAIEKSCIMKAEIVEKDEKEKGKRALLNLGHTFGHALESKINKDGQGILHGEAVGLGICLAAELSFKMNLCSMENKEEIIKIIKESGLPSHITDLGIEIHAEEMIKNFSLDKKRKDNSNTFILIDNIGSAIIKDGISDDYLKSFMISNGFK
tara:strand:- start:741 stop:1856 length:1116 start_codon:yes stop_codon:yes gene_type:complete